MNTLELKIPPVAQVIIIAAVMYGASRIIPNLQFDFDGSNTLAIGLSTIGLGSGVMGVAQFKKAQTTVNPHTPEKATNLVTRGIYQYTRNPMYLGLVLILLGWAFYLSHFLPFMLVPVFMIYMTRFQIQPEERMMTQKFGIEYQDYIAKVRRWI
ncbi:MAG: methyltransferase family protein [Psychrobacter sp.]|uniref:methyltransferase family protein n=2 Tax=Moraxellaceae TaxID=468 RepID=UPI001787E661|nr:MULTISPECIES: isoprenylcysteine carboxylmethyltransferase family protein [unclassified Psychrobacter]MBE0442131.1 isoprenylcysteine carboxylmethyltransferase family protein [Psychrobacter sp. FME13]